MGKKNFSYDKVLCKHFGRKIVLLRKEKNISQAELAFKVGISTSYLSAIERGTTDTTITTAKRIAKSFEMEITELFG